MPKAPIRVSVTGAAGQIGYSLLFRIANGDLLGKDQPVILQLLEIPDEKAQKALKGVMMELEDCAFALLAGMTPASDPMVAFKDVQVALLVGARPRGPGMERKDLLEANGKIFAPQGQALDRVAERNVKVLVVGNPANTNCLIAMKNAPSLKPSQFTGMMRLDHNRAVSQLAQKVKKPVSSIRKVTVWGNHSATQYPDLFQAEADGKKLWPMINDQAWLENTFIPTVQKRGAAVIDARGRVYRLHHRVVIPNQCDGTAGTVIAPHHNHLVLERARRGQSVSPAPKCLTYPAASGRRILERRAMTYPASA